jgi:uncharacterized membrane protein YccC
LRSSCAWNRREVRDSFLGAAAAADPRAKTALAAALCWWLALRFGLHDGYWGSISAIIVLQSNMGATVTASRDRILGTLIGAAFGFSFSLFGALPWNYILAVLAAVIVCGLLGLRKQFAAGRGHHHHRHAGAETGAALGAWRWTA